MDFSTIKPQGDGCSRLELAGGFPPEWAGSLCARLSARRINVERGFARQVQHGRWEAQLVLRPLDAGVDLQRVNYRDLAFAPKQATAGARPRLSSFTLEDRIDSLKLSIRAPDELGFLGRLLGSFSFLMLFVHEMEIQTVGSEAQDVFVLKGIGGSAPRERERARLRAMLQGMSANNGLAA
jgi:hypothetical protein